MKVDESWVKDKYIYLPTDREKELGEEWKVSFYVGTLGKKVLLNQTVTQDNIYKTETLTPRKILQLLGTECGREIIHPNIWVNALFTDYKKAKRNYFNNHNIEDLIGIHLWLLLPLVLVRVRSLLLVSGLLTRWPSPFLRSP